MQKNHDPHWEKEGRLEPFLSSGLAWIPFVILRSCDLSRARPSRARTLVVTFLNLPQGTHVYLAPPSHACFLKCHEREGPLSEFCFRVSKNR